MNRWIKLFLAVVILGVVVVVVASFFLGTIVKTGVGTVGPRLTGASVLVDDIDLSPLTGRGTIEGLVIGNPEGFQSTRAFKLDLIRVRLSVPSLFSDTILIDEITVVGPEITYERGLSGSNISVIRDNIEAFGKSGAKGKENRPAGEEAGKNVQIGNFLIRDGSVRLSASLLKGEALTVPLPEIQLKDLGKESGGATVAQVSAKIFRAINGAVVKAVAGSGNLAGKGVKEIGKAAGEAGSKALEGVRGLLGK
jgi:uncharacterized protein involved in outer membrane biogenesis